MNALSLPRVRHLLKRALRTRILVIGDSMLDEFVWGKVARISPEAPVPVVEFDHESLMPGGAANVARNLRSLHAKCELAGVIGGDANGKKLKELLTQERIECRALLSHPGRLTSVKTRIVAHHQQLARVDRETVEDLDARFSRRLARAIEIQLESSSAVIVADYGKGVITQGLLDQVKRWCRERNLWLSLDPKPVHRLNLSGLSLLTPNRKEAFELAGLSDGAKRGDPLHDAGLLHAVEVLMSKLQPGLLLITLGDQGMLLCRPGQAPFLIPTVAQEVFDVSGAGDTVIACFTLAIAAGASPVEAAIFSNHAAGVVVGKVGTAVATPQELLASFHRKPSR